MSTEFERWFTEQLSNGTERELCAVLERDGQNERGQRSAFVCEGATPARAQRRR